MHPKIEPVSVSACRFKRKANSPWESGVILGEDARAIVDLTGKVPKSVYTYSQTPYEGCFVLQHHHGL